MEIITAYNKSTKKRTNFGAERGVVYVNCKEQ